MVIIAAWIWIVLGAGTGTNAVAMTQMAGMPDMDAMMERVVWTPGYALLIFAMWWVMMVAMMLRARRRCCFCSRASTAPRRSEIVRMCRLGSSPSATLPRGAALAR